MDELGGCVGGLSHAQVAPHAKLFAVLLLKDLETHALRGTDSSMGQGRPQPPAKPQGIINVL